jgi:hypothetical protein
VINCLGYILSLYEYRLALCLARILSKKMLVLKNAMMIK